MIAVVFTGTRDGMTGAQQQRVRESVLEFTGTETTFIHGGCEGADAEFHQIVRAAKQAYRTPTWIICVHPSMAFSSWPFKTLTGNVLEKISAEWIKCGANQVFAPREPLARNTAMVAQACSASYSGRGLIATPKESTEQQRSGTWSTIRRAQKAKMPVRLILPDGAIQ